MIDIVGFYLSNCYICISIRMRRVMRKSCDDEKGNEEPLALSGKVISHSECKNFGSNSTRLTSGSSSSCVDYRFDAAAKKLFIKHINAGFNCCPDSLYCAVKMSNDTIIIKEFESKSLCKCNCLYDLDIGIEGVRPQKYVIKFIEPYCGDQEQIVFGVDFSSQTEGSYCVKRNHYPWHDARL